MYSIGLADLPEQREVLGVAGADLDDVDLVVDEGLDVARIHELGDDGHAELLARLAEQVEARLAHALAGIRRGAGLERAAAQDGRARGAHGPRDREEVLALDRAGPSHDLEVAAADEHAVTAVDDGVLGVELAVRLLERLRDALDALDDVHTLEQERIDARGVSDDADDGLGLADRDVGLEPAPLDPGDELLELLGACGLLDDSDHGEAFRRASARRCADIHVMVARRRTAPVRSRRL